MHNAISQQSSRTLDQDILQSVLFVFLSSHHRWRHMYHMTFVPEVIHCTSLWNIDLKKYQSINVKLFLFMIAVFALVLKSSSIELCEMGFSVFCLCSIWCPSSLWFWSRVLMLITCFTEGWQGCRLGLSMAITYFIYQFFSVILSLVRWSRISFSFFFLCFYINLFSPIHTMNWTARDLMCHAIFLIQFDISWFIHESRSPTSASADKQLT